MARSPSGVYTLPAGNPVASGTIIESAWANTTMNDIAIALTDSLDREGRGGMNAQLKFADESAASPGISWVNEPTTGWYRAGAGDMRASVLTNDTFRLQNSGGNGSAQVWANSQWNSLIYTLPPSSVPPGTAAWQTLAWDQVGNAWKNTSRLTVNDATGVVTVAGGTSTNLVSPLFTGNLTGTASNATQAANATTAANCSRTVTGAGGVTGGGALTSNQQLSLDTTSTRNIDHATVSMTAGFGLTNASGGDITTSRTFNVGAGTGIVVNNDDVALDLTYADARYLNIGDTAIQANTITDQAGPNPKKIFVGPYPGAGADANTIYFVI